MMVDQTVLRPTVLRRIPGSTFRSAQTCRDASVVPAQMWDRLIGTLVGGAWRSAPTRGRSVISEVSARGGPGVGVAFKQAVSEADLRAVVREALGGHVRLSTIAELTEGTFNAAYALGLSDSRSLVVKVAPVAGTPLLTYEHGLVHTESMCLQTFAGQTSVPVPKLVGAGVGATAIGRDYLLMTRVPGVSWASHTRVISADQRRVLRRQLGRYVGAMHQVTGNVFGYPAPGSSLTAATWSLAYQRIIDGLLGDAERFGVALPWPTDDIRAVLHTAADALLTEVTTPVLVHFDLWEGNVFVDLESEVPQVTGIIDHERALWADPAADFVSLALFADITRDEDFLGGYADGGGPVVLDDETRARLHLYQAHLALIMIIEMAPRKDLGPEQAEYRASLTRWLTSELAALQQR